MQVVLLRLLAAATVAAASAAAYCLDTAVGPSISSAIAVGDPYQVSASPSAGVLFTTTSGGVLTIVRVAQSGELHLVGGRRGFYDAAMIDSKQATAVVLPPQLVSFAASKTSADLFFFDGAAVFKIDASGTVRFVAGSVAGANGFANGASTSALFSAINLHSVGVGSEGIVRASDGTVFIADYGNSAVRAISPTGTVSTLASPTTVPGMGGPASLALAPNGEFLYISELSPSNRVRRIALGTGAATIVAGGGASTTSGGAATSAAINVLGSIALNPAGTVLYIVDSVFGSGNRCLVRAVNLGSGLISTVAGSGPCGNLGDNEPATSARIGWVEIDVDPSGTLWLADWQDSTVRFVQNGVIRNYNGASLGESEAKTVVGAVGTSAAASATTMNYAQGVAVADDNTIFVADTYNHVVYKIDATGARTVVAGILLDAEFAGDNGPASSAKLNTPTALAVSRGSSPTLFISDSNNNVVRVVAAGTIKTFAGSPTGAVGNTLTGPATSALLNHPTGLALHSGGDLYIVDSGNRLVKKVSGSSGAISLVAGGGTMLVSGSATPATSVAIHPGDAFFYNVVSGSIALSRDGSKLYLADSGKNFLRQIVLSSGVMTNIAGNGLDSQGFFDSNNLGSLSSSVALHIDSVAVDPRTGTVVVRSQQSVLAVAVDTSSAAGTLSLIAGDPEFKGFVESVNAVSGVFGIDGTGQMAFGPDGALYVSDMTNSALRIITDPSMAVCPAGFSCSCGRNPVPCLSPSSYCPENVAAPVSVDKGFVTVTEMSPFQSNGGGEVSIAQAPCPVGSYCIAGKKEPCSPGFFGTHTMQSDSSGCKACPNGTFLAAFGSGGLAFQGASSASPCVPCPPRSSAPEKGSGFCSWWPADSATSPDEHCEADAVSFAGPFGGCIEVPEKGSKAVTGESVIMTMPPTTYPFDVGDTWRRQVTAGAAIMVVIGFPFIMYIVASVLMFAGVITEKNSVVSRFLWPLLRAIDQIGDWKIGAIAHTMPVHWEGGPLGGACSALAMAGIIGFASMVGIAFFGGENVIASQFVLPARPEYLEDYEGSTFFKLSSAPAADPTLTQGLNIKVALQGPKCANFTEGEANLIEGEFSHNLQSSSGGNLFVHTFSCRDCFFGALSQLAVDFPPECQNAAIVVSAVSARGGVTVASFVAENKASAEASAEEPAAARAGKFLEGIEIVVEPMMDVVLDRSLPANGVSRMPPASPTRAGRSRGLLFAAEIAPLKTAVEPPAALSLHVKLTPAPTFVGISFSQKFFYIDLVYQLLATLAIGAFFTFGFLFIIERYKKFELVEFLKHEGHVSHNVVPPITFMMPGAPITDYKPEEAHGGHSHGDEHGHSEHAGGEHGHGFQRAVALTVKKHFDEISKSLSTKFSHENPIRSKESSHSESEAGTSEESAPSEVQLKVGAGGDLDRTDRLGAGAGTV